jgi:hypothetical protein
MFQKHLSSAHVIAIVALFVALGGTAFAAVTLPRDSVGAPQIRKDAVRSPEIERDAVRSPEIKKDAIRASEIRDESIGFGDVSTAAATKLRGDLRLAEDDNESERQVPFCDSVDLRVCPNFLVLELGSGATAQPDSNWLIQATADVSGLQLPSGDPDNVCGLVDTERTGPNAVLDQAPVDPDADFRVVDDLSLSAVVKKAAGNPTIALRCSRQDSGPPNFQILDDIRPLLVKIVALEVGSVTGP